MVRHRILGMLLGTCSQATAALFAVCHGKSPLAYLRVRIAVAGELGECDDASLFNNADEERMRFAGSSGFGVRSGVR
ncbi:hypothetical protein WU87_12730 [Corynebacterium minutissimum]|uniref:Uncharacterized protein n=1 Tax=Corynebacterium minutissimum TaxID=38301 RepID=A0ACC4U7W9_9CORY|nr:hypothetical protein WU87_12730 [Corynebacterium minutissimum]